MSTNWALIIITGGSRGFGRSIATSFAKNPSSSQHIVLAGRNVTELEVTKAHVEQAWSKNNSTFALDVSLSTADLENQDAVTSFANDLFANQWKDSRSYEKIIFVNNAGSLGPLQPIGHTVDFNEYNRIFTANITSSSYLSAQAIGRFNAKQFPASVEKLAIVNVSSLAAVKPFESWGLYCAGKAARDMFHQVIAEENKQNTNIRILNYAPGPLDTDMQKEIRDGENVVEGIREFFKSMKDENKLVNPDDSADKLIILLDEEKYVSGSHVDFYDL